MSTNSEAEQLLRKAALINATRFGGRAEVGSVLGKILSERPDLRKTANELSRLCVSIVEEVNRLSSSEQRNIVQTQWPEELVEKEKKREEKILPPLSNVEKYPRVVTRFSPNPDGAIHIGSTRAIILCHDYARMYNGKFILRFEDTDPRLHKPVLEFYDSIREDVRWLDCQWDQEIIQSDRMEIYYHHAKELLSMGGAYVCTCSKQNFKTLTLDSRACGCRDLPTSVQLERWEKMINGTFSEEEAIVRVKTDLNHPNPAVRDWPALRIIDPEKHPHPRVGAKYRVWPLYNFACGIDDRLLEISHIIRGKEHLTNEVRQTYMFTHFGWHYPETIHYGRLKIIGTVLSKSKMVKMIADGVVSDFADPRLATLSALRRRGITPGALRRLVFEIGPRPVDATLSWDNIFSYNRKLIDPTASRFFFVGDPVELEIAGLPGDFVSNLPLHPDHPEYGNRQLNVKRTGSISSVFISKDDSKTLSPGDIVRLMELFNVKISSIEPSKIKGEFHSQSYQDARKLDANLIHWLPQDGNINAKLVLPSANIIEGLGENAISLQKIGSIIQLVRVGFGRIDSKTSDSVVVYFAHS
ncbi:MAG: glutamate--tRNA ligase [archaeon]